MFAMAYCSNRQRPTFVQAVMCTRGSGVTEQQLNAGRLVDPACAEFSVFFSNSKLGSRKSRTAVTPYYLSMFIKYDYFLIF